MAESLNSTPADIADSSEQQPDLALEIQALQILDSSDDCIKVLDLDGRLLFMNRGGQALLGIQDITPFLNTFWVEFWQEEERQAAIDAIARAKAGEVCILQGYCPTLSGEPRWWDNKISPMRGTEGQVERLLCISRDITERRQIEDERKQAALNTEFLATVTQDLAEATCVEEIIHTIGEQLHRYLQVSNCAFVEINESKEVAAIYHSWHLKEVSSLVGFYQLAEFVTDKFLQTAKAGRTIIIRDVKTDSRIVDPKRFAALNIGSFINVPLIRDGEWKFMLNVYHQTPYNWRSDEIELMRELANRIWTKLERTRVEIALRQSQEIFSTLVADAPFGVYMIDAEFRLRQANQTAIAVFKIDPLIGRDLAEALRSIWQEPFATEAIDHFRHTLATGEPYYSPSMVESRADIAETQSYDWRIHRITLADGSYGVVCYFYDLSEIKQAEAMMRRTGDRDAFLVSLNDALRPLTDALEILATANRVLGEYLGANRVTYFEVRGADYVLEQDYVNGVESLRGSYPTESFGAALLATYRRGYTATAADVAIDPNLSAAQRSAYADAQIAAYIGVPLVKQGEFLAGLAVHSARPRRWTPEEIALTEDVAERTWAAVERARAEAALRESEAKYRSLFESIDQGFCLIKLLFDANGKPFDYRFVEINPAFEQQSGLVDVVGKTILELVPNFEPQWIDLYAQVVKSGKAIRFEADVPSLNGVFDIYAFPNGASGQNLVAILFANITDRKQAEAERELLLQREQAAREEAEQANRIKDEFLAVLSHELRSPLNPILGWSKLLRGGKLDEIKTAQALATIERNAKLQSELIEDLLDVSRILRGKLSLNAAPVNLATRIRGAMETVQLAAEAKSIQIEANLAEDVGLVWGDSTRLQQVVWNLLSNAVKFTPTGGKVEVRLEAVGSPVLGDRGELFSSSSLPSSLSPSPPYAQITVSDTGQGIAPNFLPHVFDYFRQADAATTRRFGGLGLGLAIVRHLVELHGGTVKADSLGVGQGATFTIRLPLMPTPSQANQDERPLQQSLDLSNIKILVVDDEPDTRELMAFVLEQQGAQVTVAASAHKALLMLPQVKPDVLLSDIGMPEMDGYMLIRQIRALTPEEGGRIPAIALTAYAGDTNQQRVIAAGFQKHISKPIEPEVLVQTIVQLIHWN